MKQPLFIIFLAIISLVGYSQNNLQFNKVLTYAGQFTSGNDSSAAWVVPTNKVWKIESMTNFQTIGLPNATSMSFLLNNIPIKYHPDYTSTTTPYAENYFSPIWLKAGDVVKFKGTGGYWSYYLSIIEYNLIP